MVEKYDAGRFPASRPSATLAPMKFIRPAVGTAMTMLLFGCANPLFYHPDRVIYQTPLATALPYEEVTFSSPDGTKLNGWFIPAKGSARATVVHFHGNAQNMPAHYSYVSWLPAQGYNVFVFDYRGYGKSAGTVSRQGVFEDCVAALDYVRERQDIDPETLIVFGQSLGGANALAVLGGNTNAARGVRAIAIDSAFYSYRLIVRDKIRLIPVLSLLRGPLSYFVVSNRHSPAAAVEKLPAVPKLFMHGKDDVVIPVEHSRKLFAAAPAPKELLLAEGCDHAEAIIKSPVYRAALLDFFNHALAK